MKSLLALFITTVILISKSSAGIIFETGTGAFDSTTCCGSFINENQFLGTTFSLAEKTKIDGIGGHFRNFHSSFGNIFGAIVNLNKSGLPDGSVNRLDNVLAYTIFSPLNSVDTLAPIEVSLDAGLYGLVFGSGLFGANGSSTLTLLQPYQVSSPYGDIIAINKSTPNWKDSDTNPGRYRMLISGAAIKLPEPSSLGLALISCVLMFLVRRKHA